MNKQTFLCPNCNVVATYELDVATTEIKNNNFQNIIHRIIRCDACNKLTYKIIKHTTIGGDTYSGGQIFTQELFQYPFGLVNIEEDLPIQIKNLYQEAFNCFKIGALKASAGMCRTTLIAICDDKKTQGKDLKERINNLVLSNRFKLVAKNIKWVADKTLHNNVDWELANWNKDMVQEVINFIEGIIDDLYTQERKAKELNKLISKTSKQIK